MRRLTISVDEDLARQFDQLVKRKGYGNRSEAFRDLVRRELEEKRFESGRALYCIGNLSYIYNHHERELARRLAVAQHTHHELIIATTHAHLDHDNCIESVILSGLTSEVTKLAESIMAETGVRHGKLNLVPAERHGRRHGHAQPHLHMHPTT